MIRDLILAIFIFFLASCSPKITSTISKSYEPTQAEQDVKVFELNDRSPGGADKLGEVKIGDTGFTTNCSYETVINVAKAEARKVGGNAIKVVEHIHPDLSSSCHRIVVEVYRIVPGNSQITQSIAANSAMQLVDSVLSSTEPLAVVPDTIVAEKVGNHYRYLYKGEVLSIDRLGEMLNKKPETLNATRSLKGASALMSVMGYTGGFLIGYPLGQAISGKQASWVMAAVGAGIIGLAIPIAKSADRKLYNAVRTYNMTPSETHRQDNHTEMKLALMPGGLGVSVRF